MAITGMGMVTAQGVGVEASWRGVLDGREVLRPWAGAVGSLEKIRVAQCPQLPRPEDLPGRLWRKLSRTQQLACVATDEALAQARLPLRLDGMRAGVFLATTVCGMDQNERFYAQYRVEKDAADVDLMRRLMPYEVGALIARRHKAADDPSLCQVCLTTCVGSAMAIANAADAILQGQCDVAIAGGAEALCRVVLSGFNALKVAAAEGCRPFNLNRPGMTVGEGSGILILESAEHAARRGANPLAWLRGVGITCDAHHLTAPEPGGKEAMAAIRDALKRSGMDPQEIDYINAHGTGTRDNDAMEARALTGLFEGAGLPVPPVSSTKRCTGHTFGAAAAVETIFCIQALREQVLPPNAGSQTADPACAIPVLREGAQHVEAAGAALCTNFAFGGNNTAIVVSTKPGIASESPQTPEGLSVHGVGMVSDAYESVHALTESNLEPVSNAEVLDPATVAQHDVLAQLVIRATHQSWTMAELSQADPQRLALLFISAWGTIDATVAYLETMLDAEGRYASPRHFSRSVYSSIASVTAIHFGIHGPVETLTFPHKPVEAGIAQAQRLLAAGRADRVIVVWAEQAASIAQDLCRRAVERLGRREFGVFVEELGSGAVALVLGAGDTILKVPEDDRHVKGKPFMMKRAVVLAADIVQGRADKGVGTAT